MQFLVYRFKILTDTNAPIITLRGVRSNNVTEVGDPAVGIHVDGLSMLQGLKLRQL